MDASSGNLTVFVSSPSGLDLDRKIIIDEISFFSAEQLQLQLPSISYIQWPDNIGAGAASYGQSVINRQTRAFDILVCLIGARMGSPTPRANSGTEEEFDRAIEALIMGKKIQVLLFFSNMPLPPQELDPHQLFLVRAFREKASRLGVLYHTYSDYEQLRHLFQVSLREAYNFFFASSGQSSYLPEIGGKQLISSEKVEHVGSLVLANKVTAPQWADAHIIPLAEYRRRNVRLSCTMRTTSPYFRFGFKYYDSREALFSAGSIQTVGHNILVHVGKNVNTQAWFLTRYRAGYRLGPDMPIEGTEGITNANFEIALFASGEVSLSLNSTSIYKSHFPMDGTANIALIAWGDEHEFRCKIDNIVLRAAKELSVDV